MRIKKTILILGIMAFALPMAGQNTKKMNSIKRNSQYLYAEATMETAAEAYEVASDLLLIQIKEYASEKKNLKDKDFIIKNIQGQQDSLQIRRGDMVKVFLYVRKSDIQGVENVTLVENTEPGNKSPEKGELVIESNMTPANPLLNNTSPGVVSPDNSLKLEVQWQQAVIDNLLSAGSYSEARAILARLKTEFKIKKTGPMASVKDASEVYLLIGKNGKVETVLGPGAETRTDFRNLQRTSVSYDGYDKVWFTFSK